MRTVVECQDKSGKILKSKEYNEPNPHPQAQPFFSRIAKVDREGNIYIEDSFGNRQVYGSSRPMTKEEKEQFDRSMRRMNVELHEQSEKFNREMEAFNQNMKQSMNKMQQQMAQSFGNNFPFGNSNPFGGNFAFGNSNPFAQFQSYYPSANFHTHSYPRANNFKGYVKRVYSYPSANYVPNYVDDSDYQTKSFESKSVEEFIPNYYNNRPKISIAPKHYDKYRYAY